jgi:hypothetical protein
MANQLFIEGEIEFTKRICDACDAQGERGAVTISCEAFRVLVAAAQELAELKAKTPPTR